MSTPRRERERQRHRQEILDAASALLTERGPEGLTMDEVARRAEFAVGSIYRFFGSKEELIEAMVTDHLAPFFAEAAVLVESEGSFDDVFDRVLAAYFEFVRKVQPFFRVLLLAGGPHGAPTPRVVDAGVGWLEMVEALIERGQREGALVDEDPWVLATALVGMLEAFAKRAVFGLAVDEAVASRVIRRAVLVGFGRKEGS